MTEQDPNSNLQQPQFDFEEPFSFRTDILGLFVTPALNLMRARFFSRWKPAFWTLLLLFVLGAGGMTIALLRGEHLRWQALLEDVVDKAGPLSFDGKRLSWKGGQMQAPVVVERGDWWICFSSDGGKVELPELTTARFLVVCTPEWFRISLDPSRNNLLPPAMLKHLSRSWSSFAPSTTAVCRSLDRAFLSSCLRVLFLFTSPVVFLILMFMIMKTWFLFMLVYLLCARFLWHREASFKQLLSLILNFSVVPLLCSLVWFVALRGRWEFDTIFCIALVLYMIYVNINKARLMVESRGSDE